MKRIRILGEAFDDAGGAVEWYEEQGGREVGNQFLQIFYSTIAVLPERAEFHRSVYKQFCRVLLRPFPYAIYFRPHDDWVVVVLVIHAARDPRLVRKLLRGRAE